MAQQIRVEADLRLTITPPAEDGAAAPLQARVTGSGTHLEVDLDQLDRIPLGISWRAATDVASDVATFAADAGLTITVVGPGGPVVSLGAVKAGLVDRTLTGSPHIAVRDRRAALRLLRAGRRAQGPGLAALTPPPTLWPLAPTLVAARRRRVRTTHDPLGGGDPRLLFHLPPGPELGAPQQTLHLRRGTTTIGSDPESDLVVAGLEPHHAEVRRDPATDEYHLFALTPSPATVAGEQAVDGLVLRTGARIDCGSQRLVYVRDEYADHGRPFGGRQGGEFSRQRPQRRPRYRD
ncbi:MULTISPECIES: FHA domain-containing protein [unclassified Serinicoccus]|uniref:FHA domain-containing protein n=1 Tax=unclassified Serinicoccus TaxID=2643101 RepID=UPI003852A48C